MDTPGTALRGGRLEMVCTPALSFPQGHKSHLHIALLSPSTTGLTSLSLHLLTVTPVGVKPQ